VRVAITGGPKTGKTTLAGEAAAHTDDAIAGNDWHQASALAAQWFDDPRADLCVEGVAVPRALRKWLAAHPVGKPVDEVVVLTQPHERLTPGQRTMGKGHDTVLREIEPELRRRGVTVRRP
jgi:broad-specificity NMP kinase